MVVSLSALALFRGFHAQISRSVTVVQLSNHFSYLEVRFASCAPKMGDMREMLLLAGADRWHTTLLPFLIH